ncbi:MAG: type II toxin-antitoxin system HipA family toxin YjjJ [bacterium]|nr:type II toxin-antitoxin system HipA family toxin YjjJ [bacterium]
MHAAPGNPVLTVLADRGPLPAATLRRELGVSQPTMSRLVRRAGDSIVRIGQARATRYAARRTVRALGDRWPVYRVDEQGAPRLAAQLHAIAPRSWYYASQVPAPGWMHGEFADGSFPDLPWFLDDMRPQGFMGRAFARKHAAVLGVQEDPRLWSAETTLAALLAFGDDTPGNFILGASALERFERRRLASPEGIEAGRRAAAYASLATAALANDVPGSSAGGEQPKFTATVLDRSGARHVIVKFTPTRETAFGVRWADLLVCEQLALAALREAGAAACTTEILEAEDRTFLEVTRFDRVGLHGRLGVISLQALSNAYHGTLDDWLLAADRLEQDGWLGAVDADALRFQAFFGSMIRNSDMHFGNVSLAIDAVMPLCLAPAYDMLPMHYRPSPTGEIVERPFEPRIPPVDRRALWVRAAEAAGRFWGAATEDARISEDFRRLAAEVLATNDRVLATYR